jgi:putative restriction endonuclease
MARVFGEISGYPVGSTWENRSELSKSGVHAPPMAGISGTGAEGADSIVVNGGYEDDDDLGYEIIYTGAGGNDPKTKGQIADQVLDQPGNAGLVTSQLEGLPVRVIRGSRGSRAFSPEKGFRYDGIFRVTEHWSEIGKSGFRIWRFKLDLMEGWVPQGDNRKLPSGNEHPVITSRYVASPLRISSLAREVKQLYQYCCQFCGAQLPVPGGHIAEGAHIRPLGRPHYGPDTISNLLCLCPNHHALFDAGGIYVDAELSVKNQLGETFAKVKLHSAHELDLQHFEYHRRLWGY